MATIFPLSASVGQIFGGYEFDGTSWNIIGIDLTVDYALDSELTAHEEDTTNVHGILNTASIVSGSGIANIVALTQAEYDAIPSPSATTLYVVTD